MTIDQILGWTATVLFTVCYIPQIVKTIRTGTIEGVSVWMFLIQFVANVIALAYAVDIGQKPLVVKYVLALWFVGGTLTTIIVVWWCGFISPVTDAAKNADAVASPDAYPRASQQVPPRQA